MQISPMEKEVFLDNWVTQLNDQKDAIIRLIPLYST
ncbi:hypothetical protein GGC63_004330 [Paenibacillus sp. OAS669]|nr:hypothetical protein [Paenibacillus sp. OAS669]